MESNIREFEEQSAKPDFWEDPENSHKIMQKIKCMKHKIDDFKSLCSRHEDIAVLTELALEENDDTIAAEIQQDIERLRKDIANAKIKTLLNDDYDKNNAILTLHAGAGGTEAQDWVSMLLRMYTRWAEARGYTVSILDFLEGEEAGVKSVTINVIGQYAYGYLKSEIGVHRLVRISPFDASGRRHTSFASVEVLPELDESIQITILPEELKIDTYRSSGAGGQHVNKTSSAIRITHIPTGIVVSCQNERSQFQNKENAMKMLKAKLLEIKDREQKQKIGELKGDQAEIGWGNQIRSYVFCPYTLVKDHRTNYEEGNVAAVMDGDIDSFINEYLGWRLEARS